MPCKGMGRETPLGGGGGEGRRKEEVRREEERQAAEGWQVRDRRERPLQVGGAEAGEGRFFIYDVLSAVFVGKARKLATADTG